MIACNFFVSVTVHFQIIYIFVMIEVDSQRLMHFNSTSHPASAWTLQQSREAIDNSQDYRFLIHDRDSIYSHELDVAVRVMGVRILETPFRSPRANSDFERLISSLRRGCLDFLIPMNERHLREILKEYQTHYNQGLPHSSLGPGFPEPRQGLPMPLQKRRHQRPEGDRVMAKPNLAGLHHEYGLDRNNTSRPEECFHMLLQTDR
jgi:putative transposase